MNAFAAGDSFTGDVAAFDIAGHFYGGIFARFYADRAGTEGGGRICFIVFPGDVAVYLYGSVIARVYAGITGIDIAVYGNFGFIFAVNAFSAGIDIAVDRDIRFARGIYAVVIAGGVAVDGNIRFAVSIQSVMIGSYVAVDRDLGIRDIQSGAIVFVINIGIDFDRTLAVELNIRQGVFPTVDDVGLPFFGSEGIGKPDVAGEDDGDIGVCIFKRIGQFLPGVHIIPLFSQRCEREHGRQRHSKRRGPEPVFFHAWNLPFHF